MGSKRLKADILAAAQKIASGSVAGTSSISGASDEEFTLTYHHPQLAKDVRIQVVAQNSDEYPEGNNFMLFTEDADTNQLAVDAIQNTQDYIFGLRVYEVVTELAKQLDKALNPAKGGKKPANGDDEEEDFVNSDFDGDEEGDDFGDDWSDDAEAFGLHSEAPQRSAHTSFPENLKQKCQRIIHDLRQVRKAGYKVGFLDSLGKNADRGIVSLSIRVKKLALSDEALEAWNIDEDDYLVLLARFEDEYAALGQITARPASHTRVAFRVGKCKKYKPSLAHALGAFAESSRVGKTKPPPTDVYDLDEKEAREDGSEFHRIFISASLDQFMNESFISLLKIREATACSWDAANNHLIERTGLGVGDGGNLRCIPEYRDDPMDIDEQLESHRMLACDHLTDNDLADKRSFPLVAMQFAVRYVVKCTEYCLRCHRRLGKEFEAIRPYVCSEPLCLFQYMAMGFGPNIEHEITTQPYVVELLVSLCYAGIQSSYYGQQRPQLIDLAAAASNPEHTTLPIRALPVGLRLQIPDLFPSDKSNTQDPTHPFRAHWSNTRLLFDLEPLRYLGSHLKEDKWIAFRIPGQSLVRHAVITKVDLSKRSIFFEEKAQSGYNWGTGMYTSPAALGAGFTTPNMQTTAMASPLPSEDPVVEVFIYDTDFDTLDNVYKGEALRHILDTLPPILEMEDFLNKHPHSTIRSMGQVSPAAASILQWIVSSNRSCIYQIDHTREVITPNGDRKHIKLGKGKDRSRERIPDMQGWVQFRFAQGSPDKEFRFKRALQEVAARKNIKSNPTIFAWHGSSLCNWHSIVRTGLDFNETRNGRVYGHGVYFSPEFSTSLGYSSTGAQPWPNSELKINVCMSLNEIVNAPDEFVSQSPHYVVDQLDWHQCRYLFVRTEAGVVTNRLLAGLPGPKNSTSNNPAYHKQPSGHAIMGPNGSTLGVPLSAIPFRHVGAEPSKQAQSSKRDLERSDDSSDDEDSKFLDSDPESGAESPPTKRVTAEASSIGGSRDKAKAESTSTPPSYVASEKGLTDFVPGALNWSTLPCLKEPEFANPAASKHLASELKKLRQTQSETPLHELGWYMDFDRIDNLFQWIVELHTFEASLPLAKDMKKAGVTSVVLEIRFPKDFPFSPPFIRVVRPRFLPFLNGGGGHVTAGGAMCMELLTGTGWSPVNSMESVLLQVRVAMCNLEPKPARLQSGGAGDYGVGEAVEAYLRAVRVHGWKVPEDLQATALGGQTGFQ
ncbi:hypothetical protein B0T16DRAFT_323698 [Cercophora newfieldiana]|uniref:UBC core domain-containing protein n=1 Tax=Cercophora newfieldiana TaxID=92897 RepID=A0AA40CWX4_9PEZI|nr:hypothetical protein B0T16DRAFT_323698 [Cercophora newfieldiana]